MSELLSGILALIFGITPVFAAAPNVLRVSQGGTGASSFTIGECLKGNGTGPITTGTCGTGAADGTFSTTSADFWINQYSKGFFFSTTSADYWETQQAARGGSGSSWATTSTNYWETTKWRWATTSSDYWLTQNQGLAFSTTSANWWGSTKGYLTIDSSFSTTSADYWDTTKWRWATTSASYHLSQNQGLAFSTTSASWFLSLNQGNAFSTTSANYWGSTKGYLDAASYYATTTHKNISSLPALSITKSQVSDFGTYESVLTFNYPLSRNVNTVSVAATSTAYGTGTGGYVLAWANGQPSWQATSTCIQITGSAALCDGDDATGGGGGSWGTITGTLSSQTDLDAAFKTKLGTSSPLTANQLVYATGFNTVASVGTSTLSASSPLTGSFVQVGTGGTLGIQAASASQAGSMSASDYLRLYTATTTFTAPLVYTGGTNAVTCTTATASVPGCLAAADFTTFNLKQVNIGATTTAPFMATWYIATGTRASVIPFASTTAITAENLNLTNNLTFNGVTGSTWASFCTTITGSSALCDGNDATGAGGGSWPFTPDFYNSVANQSTTTPLWLKNTMVIASTTMFSTASIGTTVANSLLTVSTSTSFAAPLGGTYLHMVGADGAPLRISMDTYNNNNNFGSQIQFRRARGTSGSASAVAANDTIFSLAANGYGSTGFPDASVGSFNMMAGAAFTDTSAPTYFTFYTTPANSITQSERMRITQDGLVGIATTSPWGLLSLVSNTNPQFVVATSTGATPLFMISATSTGIKDWARLTIGGSSMRGIPVIFPLYVNGAIYSNKRYEKCEVMSDLLGLTADSAARICDGYFQFDEDAQGATSASQPSESDGNYFLEMWSGATASMNSTCNAGDGAAIVPTNGSQANNAFTSASSSPMFESYLATENRGFATSTTYATGLSSQSTGSDWGATTVGSGYYFLATSTSPTGDWYAFAQETGGSIRMQDTLIASSSVASSTYRKFNIQVVPNADQTTTAYYYIDNSLVATLSVPVVGAGSRRGGLVPFTSIGCTTAGNAKFLRLSYMRAWADLIPGR